MGAAIWHKSRPERPKPWNTEALKAQWDTMEFTVAGKDVQGYAVLFYYNLRNNTDKNYPLSGSTLTVMAVLTDGNQLAQRMRTDTIVQLCRLPASGVIALAHPIKLRNAMLLERMPLRAMLERREDCGDVVASICGIETRSRCDTTSKLGA